MNERRKETDAAQKIVVGVLCRSLDIDGKDAVALSEAIRRLIVAMINEKEEENLC